MKGRRVALGRFGLQLAPGVDTSEELALVGAGLEAYRLSPSSWSDCLGGIRDLGLSLIEVQVPWALHEISPGRIDLSGERRGNPEYPGYCSDLKGFLDVCQDHGVRVILAPGPFGGRGMRGAGLPGRLRKDAALFARGPSGEPLIVAQPPLVFAQPSLAAEAFLDAAAEWLTVLAGALVRQRYPEGPIVAIRLQAQPGPHARSGAYDGDYHPEAVAHYRSFLAERFPDGLPESYGGAVVSSLAAPTRFSARDTNPRLPVDWLAAGEALSLAALSRFADAVVAGGLDGLPLLSASGPSPFSDGFAVGEAEQIVDVVGLRLATLRPLRAAVRRAVQRRVGASRLPYVADLAWGASVFWGVPDPHDQLHVALTALMHGARGLMLEAVVGHDERVGAALDRQGRPAERAAYEATRRLVSLMTDLELHKADLVARVGLLEPRAAALTTKARALLAPLPPELLALLGLEAPMLTDPADDAVDAGAGGGDRERCAERLDGGRCAFVRLEGLAPKGLRGPRRPAGSVSIEVLVLAEEDRAACCDDPALLAELNDFVARGGKLFVAVEHVVKTAATETVDLVIDGELAIDGETADAETAGCAEALAALPPHTVVSESALGSLLAAELGTDGDCDLPSFSDDTNGAALYALRRQDAAHLDGALFVANRDEVARRVRFRAEGGSVRSWDALDGVPVDLTVGLDLPLGEVRLLRVREAEETSS